MTYEEYEILCEKQREKNKEYLDIFEKDLIKSELGKKTINNHLSNVDFYINDFILREEPLEMKEGCGYYLSSFLGDYFIRKCAWSTPATIKTTAASIKKFYMSMLEHEYVSKEDYQYLSDIIKNEMRTWQADCARFNDDW